MINRFFFYFSILIFTCLAAPVDLKAAQLYLVGEEKVGVNGDILLNLVLETDQSVNAIEGEITFPNNLLQVKDIRTANSVINFWVDGPKIDGQKINFSGITPGGVWAKTAPVFSIILHSTQKGEAVIDLTNAKVLLNNGEGTPLALEVKPFKLQIIPGLISQLIPELSDDQDPPESFQPIIGRDSNLLDGKNFIAFTAVDKNSGVAGYQVKEVKYRPLYYFTAWQKAGSPYLLSDQTLTSYVYVKAVDRLGNERIVKLNPQLQINWYENIWFWVIIILVILFLVATRIKNEHTD